MAFKSSLNLKSKLFSRGERRRVFGNVVSRVARDFKESTRRKIVESKPAGRIEKYEGTRRSFRRSKRGQRPAVETTTLINALRAKRTGDLSAFVDVADKKNPKNGASARDYAEKLQKKLDRKIMTDEDRKEARENFDKRSAEALKTLT